MHEIKDKRQVKVTAYHNLLSVYVYEVFKT